MFRDLTLADRLVLLSHSKALLSRSLNLTRYMQTLCLGRGYIVELSALCNSLTNVSESFLRVGKKARSLRKFLSSLSSLSSLSLHDCRLSRTVVRALFRSCTSLQDMSFKACRDYSNPSPIPFVDAYKFSLSKSKRRLSISLGLFRAAYPPSASYESPSPNTVPQALPHEMSSTVEKR